MVWGAGIPDHLKQQVQERFYRIDNTQQLGSGLGLSIVQRIAEVHRATLQLSDASLGGLCARVFFPVVTSHAEDETTPSDSAYKTNVS